MKKVVFLLILFVFCEANAVDANVPSQFSIVTFAIGKYEDDWQKEMPVAKETAKALVNSFKSNINKKYPNVAFLSKQYENENVTRTRFKGGETDNYNFVFYNGHGSIDKITMWPKNERIRNTDKSFKGKTFLVLFNSCLVFKNGEANQDAWFNGVHSILGYSSFSWGYKKYKHYYRCGFLNIGQCSYSRASYYVERDFATNWIKEKRGIWDSYKNAVYKWIYKEGGIGVEPKIVYRYGYVDGKFFDPWEETFENSIQKPVFRKKGEYTGVGSRWSTMGTPCYSTPCK